MKKLTCLLVITFLLFLTARSQDLGYKTIDVGGEFLGSPKGYTVALHLAYNLQVHHGFQFRIAYNRSNWKDKGKHDMEEGSGAGFSLGYRYYFLVRPHGFFLGAKADVWRLKINWQETLFIQTNGTSKIWALQPAAEMGYMFLINDLFFISPTISTGIQTNIQTEGEPVGDGFIPQFGLSAGWIF